MSVQRRVTCAVCVAAFVAAQVMTVSAFGFLAGMRNASAQQPIGNSPLAQMLSAWKGQASTAAQPYVNQMMQPLTTIANNVLSMVLLSAQMMNNIAKEKLNYLSNMATVPQQPNTTAGGAATPTPSTTTPAPTPQANTTTG